MSAYQEFRVEVSKGCLEIIYHPVRGIYRLILPSFFEKGHIEPLSPNDNGEKSIQLKRIFDALQNYFLGGLVKFDCLIDFSDYTVFQKKILQVVQKIPYGETRSYSEVALMAGDKGAQRAVGMVMSLNRCPLLVPCHRVIKADKTLGGYSAGSGWKNFFLDLERR